MIKGVVLDAEVNGLYGSFISISALAVDENGEVQDSFNESAVCETENPWIKENVLPFVVEPKFETSNELLKAFFEWYLQLKTENPTFKGACFAHIGCPVEANIFVKGRENNYFGDWEGAFPLHDIASILLVKGENPLSVDAYIEKYGLTVNPEMDEGQKVVHNSLYDCYVQLEVLMHLCPEIFKRL